MIINAEANRLPLPDKSVHCIVTSPPYWGLRDYGVPPRVWGGDTACQHAWGPERRRRQNVQRDHHNKGTRGTEPAARARGFVVGTGATCEKCGAWRGHFGQESLHDCLGWATGNRDAIYRALVAYYAHKNGQYGSRGTKKFRAECRDCLDRRREAQL